MYFFVFFLLIIILILQISILSTCSDINDNLLDIERSVRQLPRRYVKMYSIDRRRKK